MTHFSETVTFSQKINVGLLSAKIHKVTKYYRNADFGMKSNVIHYILKKVEVDWYGFKNN